MSINCQGPLLFSRRSHRNSEALAGGFVLREGSVNPNISILQCKFLVPAQCLFVSNRFCCRVIRIHLGLSKMFEGPSQLLHLSRLSFAGCMHTLSLQLQRHKRSPPSDYGDVLGMPSRWGRWARKCLLVWACSMVAAFLGHQGGCY